MRTQTLAFTLLASMLLAGGAAHGQIDPGPWNRRGPAAPPRAQDVVKVRLLSTAPAFVPGRTAHLAVAFEIVPHWHIYWRNAGASGAPPRIAIDAPDGWTIGEAEFPRPAAFDEEVGRTYGYAGQAVLFVPVTAPATATAGSVDLSVRVSYMVCREMCLLGRAERTITVSVQAVAPGSASDATDADRALLERQRRRLPRPLTALDGASATYEADALVVTGPARGHAAVELFPIDVPGVTFGEATVDVRDDRFRVTVPVEIRPLNALGETIVLRGVLGLGESQDAPSYEIAIEPVLTP